MSTHMINGVPASTERTETHILPHELAGKVYYTGRSVDISGRVEIIDLISRKGIMIGKKLKRRKYKSIDPKFIPELALPVSEKEKVIPKATQFNAVVLNVDSVAILVTSYCPRNLICREVNILNKMFYIFGLHVETHKPINIISNDVKDRVVNFITKNQATFDPVSEKP